MATNLPAGWEDDHETETGLADVNRNAVNLKKKVTSHLRCHEAVLQHGDGEVLLSAYQVDELRTTVTVDLNALDKKLDEQIEAFNHIQSMAVIKTSEIFSTYMQEKVDDLYVHKD